MNMGTNKRKDGFEGQLLISLPEAVCLNHARKHPAASQIYVTHIGYFPKAIFHYRLRKSGCKDDILFYCLRGKGWYRIGNRQFDVGPNQYAIIPATTQYLCYGADEEDPWTIYWVHFSGPDMSGFNRSLNIDELNGARDIPFNETGLQIWENMYKSLEMGYSTENLTNANFCLHQFIATFIFPDRHLQHKNAAEENYITQTIYYMRSRLHEKLTVEDFAARYNFSASYFSSLFRKATGMPPIDYFIHLKIQKACQLLFQNNLKVKDVAEAVGYDDPYHFSRLFKKHMNVSPEQYKSTNRKGA